MADVTIEQMRVKYPWEPDMTEISGFGGDYEAMCRTMFYGGMAWLESREKPVDLKMETFANIYGVLEASSSDARLMEAAVMEACHNNCSGAMHQAVMTLLFYVSKNGWPWLVTAMKG